MADPIHTVIPVHLSTALHPNVHLHQFPLLTRPLQVPPSAAIAGKRILARYKPKTGRFEVHVPVDVRTEVWNAERGRELGEARADEDAEEKGLGSERSKSKGKHKDEALEQRLNEVRMRSEQIPNKGAYMLGVLRDGKLHLHPISQTHQLRPSLTYLDVLSKKTSRRKGDAASDSDDGPPPDPDDPNPPPITVKKEKPPGEAREVQLTARKTEERGMQQFQGGLTQMRRDMLMAIRDEAEERWEDLHYFDGQTLDEDAFGGLFSKNNDSLNCKTAPADLLKGIKGL